MAKSVITSAFIRLKAQQAAEGTPVVLDEFIFANVPDLNPETPVSPTKPCRLKIRLFTARPLVKPAW